MNIDVGGLQQSSSCCLHLLVAKKMPPFHLSVFGKGTMAKLFIDV